MFSMDRPSRKTKSVNYCESKGFEDDDEDFAFAKGPPSKKNKEAFKQPTCVSSQESKSRSPSQKSRKPMNVKILERDLDAAISLSLLNPLCEASDLSSALQDPFLNMGLSKDPYVQTLSVDEHTEPLSRSLHLSNCSVDTMRLGLDQIKSEPNKSQKMKEASDLKIIKKKTEDDDYQPGIVSDSGSDEDYRDHDSEDEEFTVKKVTQTKKEKQTIKVKQPPSTKKKTKSTDVRTSLTNNPSGLSRSTSLNASKPATCLSPATNRTQKWTPPGQIGKGSSSNSPPVRSPSQGLRLGLSRLVRVKPLHPSVTSH
ncbi:unnamed protein product [Knipowitschia caucasica]